MRLLIEQLTPALLCMQASAATAPGTKLQLCAAVGGREDGLPGQCMEAVCVRGHEQVAVCGACGVRV